MQQLMSDPFGFPFESLRALTYQIKQSSDAARNHVVKMLPLLFECSFQVMPHPIRLTNLLRCGWTFAA